MKKQHFCTKNIRSLLFLMSCSLSTHHATAGEDEIDKLLAFNCVVKILWSLKLKSAEEKQRRITLLHKAVEQSRLDIIKSLIEDKDDSYRTHYQWLFLYIITIKTISNVWSHTYTLVRSNKTRPFRNSGVLY